LAHTARTLRHNAPFGGPLDQDNAERANPTAWIKRSLFAFATISVAVGGVAALGHFGQISSAVEAHDRWAVIVFPVTEGVAWLSTPIMLGTAARRLGVRKVAFKLLPTVIRELQDDRAFRWSMNANSLGAIGTAAALVSGGLSLPAPTQPLAFGVAAASIAISSVPLKIGYIIGNRRHAARGSESR
jgi:hypothetical protein